MTQFRFTINVGVPELGEDEFEVFAGELLDALYVREFNGDFGEISLSGRIDERLLRVQVVFECEAFNQAHNEGYRRVSETFEKIGAQLVTDGPVKAVTEAHDGEDFDTKVEVVSPTKRDVHVRDAKTELIPA